MPPGLQHAAIALVLQAIIGAPVAVMLLMLPPILKATLLPLIVGGAFAFGFYVGRERRQSEEWFKTNRLAPWVWRPRAFRDMFWPLAAVLAPATGVILLYFGGLY